MPESIANLPDPELHGMTRANVFGIRNHLAAHYAEWLSKTSPLVEPIPLDELYSAGNLAIAETLAHAGQALTTTDLATRIYHAIRHAILTVWYEEYLRQHPTFVAVDVERIAAHRRYHYAA